MAIQFSVAKRGVFPGEEGEMKDLQPRLYSRETVDAVEFQRKAPWGTVMSYDTLGYALGEVRRTLLHEMRDGKAVTLPGIGTFRLSLKGGVEVRDGNYRGRDVHVDGILFTPDRKLRKELCALPVNQVPVGLAVGLDDRQVEERLTALFREKESVTHKQVFFAFEASLTHHRVVTLLARLVREGRLIREGERSQTRYRAAEGHFGR